MTKEKLPEQISEEELMKMLEKSKATRLEIRKNTPASKCYEDYCWDFLKKNEEKRG